MSTIAAVLLFGWWAWMTHAVKKNAVRRPRRITVHFELNVDPLVRALADLSHQLGKLQSAVAARRR